MLTIAPNINTNAQYLYDIGIGGGMSGYMGEASRTPFTSPGYDIMAMYRSNLSRRFAAKLEFNAGKISGSSTNIDDTYPGTPKLCDFDFATSYQAIDAMLETNFFPYPFSKEILNSKDITPFIFIGVGLINYEYQTSNAIDSIARDLTLSMPFGVGARWRFSDAWGLQFQFKASKLFVDNFDRHELNDPMELDNSSAMSQDWLFNTTLTLTYSFGKNIWDCNCPGGYKRKNE